MHLIDPTASSSPCKYETLSVVVDHSEDLYLGHPRLYQYAHTVFRQFVIHYLDRVLDTTQHLLAALPQRAVADQRVPEFERVLRPQLALDAYHALAGRTVEVALEVVVVVVGHTATVTYEGSAEGGHLSLASVYSLDLLFLSLLLDLLPVGLSPSIQMCPCAA